MSSNRESMTYQGLQTLNNVCQFIVFEEGNLLAKVHVSAILRPAPALCYSLYPCRASISTLNMS